MRQVFHLLVLGIMVEDSSLANHFEVGLEAALAGVWHCDNADFVYLLYDGVHFEGRALYFGISFRHLSDPVVEVVHVPDLTGNCDSL